MKKHDKSLCVAVSIAITLGIAVGVALCLTNINPPKDDIAVKELPLAFFCESDAERIDFQTDGHCAAYASAYVLRCMGEQADGESVSTEIQRVLGFVPAKSIVNVFEKHGFSASAYCGDVDTLKWRLTAGVPVIAFVSIPGDTHYVVVVGYDQEYFYLADSLAENKNADGNGYNRKLTADAFETIWKTDTVLSDNIYIVAEKPAATLCRNAE